MTTLRRMPSKIRIRSLLAKNIIGTTEKGSSSTITISTMPPMSRTRFGWSFGSIFGARCPSMRRSLIVSCFGWRAGINPWRRSAKKRPLMPRGPRAAECRGQLQDARRRCRRTPPSAKPSATPTPSVELILIRWERRTLPRTLSPRLRPRPGPSKAPPRLRAMCRDGAAHGGSPGRYIARKIPRCGADPAHRDGFAAPASGRQR